MQKLYLLFAALCITVMSMAQADSTKQANDTIVVGGMIIIRTPSDKNNREAPSRQKKVYKNIWKKNNPDAKITTDWAIVDLGFNNFNDRTNYNSPQVQQLFNPEGTGKQDWFDLRNGKSINVNIWFFMQRVRLVKNVLNLKYGLGLELYNFRYTQPIRFDTDPTNTYSYYYDADRHYSKNKLATDYLAVPVMLNYNFTPNKIGRYSFGISAGVSMGYLYNSRQKTITSEDGKNKDHNNFDIEKFKLSYIAELQMGCISLYGSYASKSIFKNGINQTPYAIGIRLSHL